MIMPIFTSLFNFKCYRTILFLIVILILAACSSKEERYAPDYKDTNALNILVGQYANNIEKIWGPKEILIAGPKDYVQYQNELMTRIHINFISGKLTIETLSSNPENDLKIAIVQTLLMPEPTDIVGDYRAYDPTQEPFLYKQIVDFQNEPIRYEWRANKFAEELLSKKLKYRYTSDNRRISYVVIDLVPDHVNERAHKFLPYIKQYSSEYAVEQKLILSIMEVESNFNPFAVSRTDALGLMQVQQHTAGRDLYSKMGKRGEPSRKFLLDPKNNIMMGTAYLALIRDNYLVGIRHPQSLKYAMISSYNGGAGSVLRVFSSDRKKAIDEINKLTPQQVYNKLIYKHPSGETRNYLKKVNQLLNKK